MSEGFPGAAEVYAWTDSTIVLSWLSRSPQIFKTYVGNRVSEIIDQIPQTGGVTSVQTTRPTVCLKVFSLLDCLNMSSGGPDPLGCVWIGHNGLSWKALL